MEKYKTKILYVDVSEKEINETIAALSALLYDCLAKPNSMGPELQKKEIRS